MARRPVGHSWQRSVQLNCNCRPRSDVITEVASEGAGGGMHWPRPDVDEVEQGGVDEVVGEGSHEGCGESGSWRCWQSLVVKVRSQACGIMCHGATQGSAMMRCERG